MNIRDVGNAVTGGGEEMGDVEQVKAGLKAALDAVSEAGLDPMETVKECLEGEDDAGDKKAIAVAMLKRKAAADSDEGEEY